MRVSHSGSYLGFKVGLVAGEDAWAAPIKKFKKAVIAWAERGLGICLTVLVYNTHILPKRTWRNFRAASKIGQLQRSGPSNASFLARQGGCRIQLRRACKTSWACRCTCIR